MDKLFWTLGFTVLILQAPIVSCAFNSTVEGLLRSSLLSSYYSGVRPDAIVDVGVLFNIITINELNIRSEAFSVSGWFIMHLLCTFTCFKLFYICPYTVYFQTWTDDRLIWDNTIPLYSATNFMFFTQAEIWRPTLIVENSVDDLSVIEDDNVPFRVFSSGKVIWNPPGIYNTYCDIDITYYPFDTQTCYISLKSVGYNIRELNLTVFSNGVKTTDFKENGEWTVISATSSRSESTDTTDAETYATLQITFTIKRRTEYYGLNIILPVIILATLSSFVFLLPLESGEKMGYSLTVLLAIAVFLTLIADQIPTTSKSISLLTIYITIVVILNALSVLATLLSLDIYFRDEKTRIPDWLRKLTTDVMMPFACWGGCCQGKSNKISSKKAANLAGYQNKASYAVKDAKMNENTSMEMRLSSEGEEMDELTWGKIAKVLDACFLRISVGIIIIITVIIFGLLHSQ
ncbi:neuronal acetylcholine receptor subunit alpha-7-like [Gigantopelta aegis]|uniref:neuronal acetylcholine receptor subunit alpha-7-like n=1 Tax=Gigantopelta aegis TaxID=1735272 RepID=UPI001B88777F|nr:neuronal acetylcholine receptor subunit alpha-7-like [Gigantopelta aegis]